MGRHTTSTSPMRSKAVLGALPIAASVVTLSAGSFAGTALASESHEGPQHDSHGVSQQVGNQSGSLAQKSSSAAPATQSAPSSGISLINLGDHDKGQDKHEGHKGHGKGHEKGHEKGSDHGSKGHGAPSKDFDEAGHQVGGVSSDEGGHGSEHGKGDDKSDGSKHDKGHDKGHGSDHAKSAGQSVDNHANNAANAVSGNSGGVKQQLEQKGSKGKHGSVQGATQTGTLGQESASSAPAYQFAPSTGVSVVSFGGGQKVDNHANNSAKATSGNSGGVDQQLAQKGSQGKHGKSSQSATQNGALGQKSESSAPASQFAPSTAISVLSFGGDQKVDNHANNSATATSGNSGGIAQQLQQG